MTDDSSNVVDLNRRINALEQDASERESALHELSGKSGNGGGGNMLEARVAKVEAAVEAIQTTLTEARLDIREIRTDQKSNFKLLLIAGTAATISVLGVMAAGFGWL